MLFKVTVLFILVLGICTACDMDQTKDGCRIRNGICSCGFGCISEYRYETMAECNSALKGKRRDSCYPNPCMNGGSCIQISQRPYFICRCDGTGFFGQRCHRACPTQGASGSANIFPYECIVI
ncbi:neurogenic locus notch homolog protein 4-like isoform X1 [Coccinella septempunctata]|uniref:neurogenic locus notch homolog protein 4-like isoform X1 n=1 Tax=Coccinella septempunctata TaxID=41139 RepID=UPI001D08AB22|nr:neurogenic locus notch homolog protein 4-like isoform X1 [Coccinella septempunctata]